MFAALVSLEAVPSRVLQSLQGTAALAQVLGSTAVVAASSQIQTSATLFQGSPQYRIGGFLGEPSSLQWLQRNHIMRPTSETVTLQPAGTPVARYTSRALLRAVTIFLVGHVALILLVAALG